MRNRIRPLIAFSFVFALAACGTPSAKPDSTDTPATASATPSRAATLSPSVTPSPTTRKPVVWTGPVRSDAGGLGVVPMSIDEEDTSGSVWADPRDATTSWVDITRLQVVSEGQDHWYIDLAATPPPAAGLDRAETLIAYGLVFEITGDGVPDYEVGISNDAPTPGNFRVWVTDLAMGETDERTEGPYGFPVEFGHPDELAAPLMIFTFVGGSAPSGLDATSLFYAWASVRSGDEVVAWDYAPDAGWLRPAPDVGG